MSNQIQNEIFLKIALKIKSILDVPRLPGLPVMYKKMKNKRKKKKNNKTNKKKETNFWLNFNLFEIKPPIFRCA